MAFTSSTMFILLATSRATLGEMAGWFLTSGQCVSKGRRMPKSGSLHLFAGCTRPKSPCSRLSSLRKRTHTSLQKWTLIKSILSPMFTFPNCCFECLHSSTTELEKPAIFVIKALMNIDSKHASILSIDNTDTFESYFNVIKGRIERIVLHWSISTTRSTSRRCPPSRRETPIPQSCHDALSSSSLLS